MTNQNKDRQMRILVCPIPAVGHVNACTGVALPLLKRGHRVAFFLEDNYKGKLSSKGFEEFLYEPFRDPDEEEKMKKYKNPGEGIAQLLLEKKILGDIDIDTQIRHITDEDHWFNEKPSKLKKMRVPHDELKKVIAKFEPDLFIVDNISLDPAINYSNKPWVKIISTVPLFYLHDIDELPPCWTGFPTESNDREEWPKFREMMNKLIFSKEFNNRIEEWGYKRYENNRQMPDTQSLTIYACPEEYDYPQIKTYKKHWFNIEVFNKNQQKETVDLKELIPEKFLLDDLDGKFSGKWIYVSMGSMGSIDLNLMNRLIDVLKKTPHKYIVSKGPRHEDYELERNMWGDRFLPQTKIVPLVDLVLTHGGNNTITETYAQGKPMIVFPLFADQHDNAQRLSEKGLATKLNPYRFTEPELLNAIEKMLNDENLNQRLKQASERIQNSNTHEQVCKMIEDILDKANRENEKNGHSNGTNHIINECEKINF